MESGLTNRACSGYYVRWTNLAFPAEASTSRIAVVVFKVTYGF
jgi:hypothetical protein